MFKSTLCLPFDNKDKIKTYLKSDEEFENSFLNKYSEFKLSLLFKNAHFKKKFLSVAKSFILESLVQMYKRLPFSNDLLNNCEVLQLVSFEKEKWIGLFKHFKIFSQISGSDLEHELDLLYIRFEGLRIQKDNMNDLISFWFGKKKDFPLISKIALTAYTLPYSSAGVERAFSVLKDIKSSKRNRMCADTLEASLLIHQSLPTISEFNIEDDLLSQINLMWRQTIPAVSQKESLEGMYLRKKFLIVIEKDKFELESVKEIELEEEFSKESPSKEIEMESEDYLYKEEKTNKRVAKEPINQEEFGLFFKQQKMTEK